MDRQTAMVIMTSIIGGTIMLGLVLQAAVTIWSKRRRGGGEIPEGSVARLEDRLSRIEQAVEAISVEVERISEGQRFTTRLLSERASERAPERV